MQSVAVHFLLALLFFQPCKSQTARQPNHIDTIETAAEIQELVVKINAYHKHFEVNENLFFTENDCAEMAKSLQMKPWQKADFDRNGLTDIIVIGKRKNYPDDQNYTVLCILDKGNRKYELKRLTRRYFQPCAMPVVQMVGDTAFIDYYYPGGLEFNLGSPGSSWFSKDNQKKKRLVYLFGDFIEYNENPAKHKIEKLEYSTSACFGGCAEFKLTIFASKSATITAIANNKTESNELMGTYKTTIADTQFNEIVNLLNYINFPTLDNKYRVNWSDEQTSDLKITFDKGLKKSIHDYGMIGTFGLDRLYELLFDLRENQKWVKKQ